MLHATKSVRYKKMRTLRGYRVAYRPIELTMGFHPKMLVNGCVDRGTLLRIDYNRIRKSCATGLFARLT